MREQTIKAGGSDKQTHGNVALSEKPPPTEEQIRRHFTSRCHRVDRPERTGHRRVRGRNGANPSGLPHPDGVQRIQECFQ